MAGGGAHDHGQAPFQRHVHIFEGGTHGADHAREGVDGPDGDGGRRGEAEGVREGRVDGAQGLAGPFDGGPELRAVELAEADGVEKGAVPDFVRYMCWCWWVVVGLI